MILTWTELAILAAVWWVVTALHVLVTGVTGAMAGLVPNMLSVGVGPAIIRFKFMGCDARLRPLPWGGATGFVGDEVSGDSGPEAGPVLMKLRFLPIVFVLMAGPMVNLIAGCAVLLAASRTGLPALAGIVGIFNGAANLIPLPGLNGGFMLFAALERAFGLNSGKFNQGCAAFLSLLIFVGLQAGFIWTLVTRPDRILAWFGGSL